MQLVPCTSLQVSSKTNLFYENDNLLLCPVTHMLALALSDSAFEASTMQDVDQILRAQVPTHKNSLTLRWKDSMLNMPVLRQATRSTDGVRTSSDQPLTASASSRYLKRLGEATGFEHPLRHYAVRRGAGNAVDSTWKSLSLLANDLSRLDTNIMESNRRGIRR